MWGCHIQTSRTSAHAWERHSPTFIMGGINMDNENVVMLGQDNAPSPTEPISANDDKITIDALKEVIAENRATMDALRSELAEVKKSNAKLMATFDTGKAKPDTDALINELFNKYRR